MKLVTILATLAFAFAAQANETKPATAAPAAGMAAAAPAETGGAHAGMNAKKKKVAKAGKAAGGEVKKDEKTH